MAAAGPVHQEGLSFQHERASRVRPARAGWRAARRRGEVLAAGRPHQSWPRQVHGPPARQERHLSGRRAGERQWVLPRPVPVCLCSRLFSSVLVCSRLFSPFVVCYRLLSAAIGCYRLLSAAIGCYRLLSAAIVCYRLLSCVIVCYRLSSILVCSLLVSAVLFIFWFLLFSY